MRKLLALFLGLMMIFTTAAVLAEDDAPAVYQYNQGAESYSGTTEGGISNTSALEGYIRNAVGTSGSDPNTFSRMNAVGTQLTGCEKKLYNLLRPLMVQVAQGKISSTEFTFPISKLTEDVTYTLEELGCSSSSSDNEVVQAFYEKVGVPEMSNVAKVIQALMADLPYDMYWFDKTVGYSYGRSSLNVYAPSEGTAAFRFYDDAKITVKMAVAKEYSATGETKTYAIKTTLSQNIQDAITNIRNVLQSNKDKNDYNKLKAYRDWIRDHVEYNKPASQDSSWPYGNPWQLIWIFDNDSSTKVVCEGYSKGFKYLCDCSEFKGPTTVICVSGNMSAPDVSGPHMWNIVTLIDGKRYLTDVTNDHDGSLFLAGYSESQETEGGTAYRYGDIWYVYDSQCTNLFQPEELAVASGSAYSGTGQSANGFAVVWKDPTYTWAEDHSSVTAARETEENKYATVLETVGTTVTAVKPATCLEAEETTYVSDGFMNEVFSVQTETVETAPALGHDWGETTYTWNEDHTQVTASRICQRDNTHIETETVSAISAVTIQATCTTTGWTTYTSAAFTNPDFEAQEITLEDIPAIGHNWADPEYTWGEGNKNLTATRTCRNDETHVETETVDVASGVTKAATCTEKGETTYTGKGFTNAAFSAQTKTEADIEPLGHNWGEPEYVWNEDNTQVTATRICRNDKTHVENETANVTNAVTKNPACTVRGETTYTAQFKNEGFTTQEKTLDNIDPLGHDWGETTYTWNDGNTKVTASRVCKRDATHKETEEAAATSAVTIAPTCEGKGERTFTGAAYKNEAFAAQTKKTEIDPIGHAWGDPVYTWNNENTQVTATRICGNDATHTEKETVKATAQVTKAAGCESKGETSYTGAAFENKAFAVQTKTLENVDALGHDWGETTYTWNNDNTKVTATRVCKRDATHQETEEATVTSAVTITPTCEGKGERTFTGAAYKNEAFIAQTKKTEIDPISHAWGEPVYTWNDDNTQVTATRTCGNDATHKETETVKATVQVTKAAACETKGETTYTGAAFENKAFAVQIKTLENVDALGHDWGETTYTWNDDNTKVTATRVCKRDATHQETETVEVTSQVTKEATCETKGEVTYTGAAFANEAFIVQTKKEEKDALDHDWDEGEVTKEATTKEEGIRTFKCRRCEATKDETIAKLGSQGGWVETETGWTYVQENGTKTTDWLEIDGTYYCFDESGTMRTGWYEENGYTYYLGTDGKMATGDVEIDGKVYHFNEGGAYTQEEPTNPEPKPDNPDPVDPQARGWVNTNAGWTYIKDNGTKAVGWLNDGGTWYYMNASGIMQTGWISDGGVWYYMQPSGAMATGWIWDSGSWYYMKPSGAMATGWIWDSGCWYYMKSSGAMAIGWVSDGGNWYYMQPSGTMATGWVSDGGKWYYFDAGGNMATGWQYASGKWYYFRKSGAMASHEWIEDKEAEALLPAGQQRALWYWFDWDGTMATGWKEIDGQWEMFADSGEWLYTWQGN